MLAGHSATVWEGNIYIWGGKGERGVKDAEMYNSNMYVLSPQECISTSQARLRKLHVTGNSQGGADAYGASTVPKGRAYHSAACYGRYLFITGGLSDVVFASASDMEHHNSSLPVFDLERRSWSFRTTFGDVPAARCHHISVVYGDTLMVHGGYPILSNQRKELSPEEVATMQHAMYDVHELHTMTLKWTRIHTTQSPSLWGHSAIVYNADVIVFGGVDVVENSESGSIAVWSTTRQRWVWVDSQTLDLRCTMHTAVQDGGRMLVFGGVSFRTKSKLRTLYEFNLDFGSWRELHPQGNEPAGRLGHAAVVYQQTLFIIGGSIKSDGDGNSGEAFERLVHMYHVPRNAWVACDLITTDDMDVETTHDTSIQNASVGAQDHPTWLAADDTQLAQPQEQEWRSTAGSIRDTIARARAIQSLTSGAANALEQSLAGSARLNSTHRVGVGGGGSFEEAGNHFSAGGGIMADPNVHDEETWKMIDHLKAENNQLRRELEEFRQLSMGGSSRNPYEVPIYNTHFTPTLPPDDRVAPHGVQSLRSLTQIVVPRLNINVADPPRTLGNERSGHMSREAVTALINSSLRKDQPASLSLASRLAKRDDNVSLDPMSYLHVTSNVARANANGGIGGGGPLTYDQLLAKTAGGGYVPQSASTVPTTLRPLLSLLASSASGAPAPEYEPSMNVHPAQIARQAVTQSQMNVAAAAGDRGGKPSSASLGSIVAGRSSMLALGHLRGGK